MRVGDLVRPKSNDYILASGCGWYSFAIVVRMEPFALVSEHADMLWCCTVEADNYEVFGEAKPDTLKKCMERL